MRSSLMTLLVLAVSLFAGQITEYGPTNTVNDMVQSGDTLILATGGGVVYYSLSENRTFAIEHDIEQLPDISITTLFRSESGALWAGSKSGYLYERTRGGKWVSYEDFLASKVQINRIRSYKDSHLIVGHSKGISVFDMKKGVAVSTATEFDSTGLAGSARELLIVGDTLFATVEKSVVRFDSLATGLTSFSFRTKKSWRNVSSALEVLEGLTYDSQGIHSYQRRAIQANTAVIRGDQHIVRMDSVWVWGSGPKKFQEIDTLFEDHLVLDSNGVTIDTDVKAERMLSLLRLNSGETVVSFDYKGLVRNAFDKKEGVTINGLVYDHFKKSLVAGNSDLWLTQPLWELRREFLPWRGMTRIAGDSILFYNSKTENFGDLGEFHSPLGFLADRDNNVWIGTHGKGVKQWNAAENGWYSWKVDPNSKTVARCDDQYDGGWQEIDGITQDSSGYMWFVLFNNSKADASKENTTRFAVYDPKTGRSKFLLTRLNGPITMGSSFNNFQCATDSKGNRWFFGGNDLMSESGQNESIMFPGTVDPFSDSSEVLGKGFIHTSTLKGITSIESVVAQPNGGAILVTSLEGVSVLRSDVKRIVGGGISIDSANANSWDYNFKKAAVSLAIENCTVEYGMGFDSIVTTSFWTSISEIGVERMVLKEYILNGVDSAAIQFVKGERPITISSEEFPFAKNASVSVDRKNGIVWMASDNGLGKYLIGASPELGISDNSHAKMYPNPYSKSNHSLITIDGLSPSSFIDLYTLSGKLVAHFDQLTGEQFHSTGLGKLFRWKLPSGIAPGTYLVALKDSENKDMTQLQKLVVIP